MGLTIKTIPKQAANISFQGNLFTSLGGTRRKGSESLHVVLISTTGGLLHIPMLWFVSKLMGYAASQFVLVPHISWKGLQINPL